MECKTDLSASWKSRCWCRDPGQICHQHQVCFQDECIYECFGYPQLMKDECLCNKAIKCNINQYCHNSICHDRPEACSTTTFLAEDETCTCVAETDEHITGQICQEQQVCQTVDSVGRCMSSCPSDSESTEEYCYCTATSTVCKNSEICHSTLSSCVAECPDFPSPNEEQSSCHCEADMCDQNEVCGNSGCAPACEAIPNKAQSGGCYCDDHKCNEGEMCSDEICYSNVNNCPSVTANITDPVCFCSEAEKLCSVNQICNTVSKDCTEPYPMCPEYPGVSTESACVCQQSLCNSGKLCDPSGQCRTPASCTDPTLDQSKKLVMITENPIFTEYQNVTIKCKSCNFWESEPDKVNWDLQCKSNGTWNETVPGCASITCQPLDVDSGTIDSEINSDSCSVQKYRCKNEMEFFEFQDGVSEISYQCLARYHQTKKFLE